MRDLKHLIFFEDLLQEANNDLVKQAKGEGKRALGYTCYFMPEVLLDLPGCFGVRLRAPRCTSPDIATYYMSGRTCHYGRSLLERALEGGYNFLDAEMATETCTVTCRFQEHMQMMDLIQNPDFFCEFTDVPFKKTENSYEHYREQLRAHVLKPLREKFGIDTSDEALMRTIEEHNEVCRLNPQFSYHPSGVSRLMYWNVMNMYGYGDDLKKVDGEIAEVRKQQNALAELLKDKKEADLSAEEKEQREQLDKRAEELRSQRDGRLREIGGKNEIVKQLIDLALLSNGMLKGEALAAFIKRSVDLIGK